uniref:Uncharacterized protein n=1 Tax=uncultured marine virus TaxID=186617 RepID=A0A0F7L600_9VIRU|nr:hypothetical protein [uncultured marine virus]
MRCNAHSDALCAALVLERRKKNTPAARKVLNDMRRWPLHDLTLIVRGRNTSKGLGRSITLD